MRLQDDGQSVRGEVPAQATEGERRAARAAARDQDVGAVQAAPALRQHRRGVRNAQRNDHRHRLVSSARPS